MSIERRRGYHDVATAKITIARLSSLVFRFRASWGEKETSSDKQSGKMGRLSSAMKSRSRESEKV